MRLLIAATILLSTCSTAWGKDGIMVCPDGFSDAEYFKLTKNLFGKHEDLQEKSHGTWYSLCEPMTKHYTQYCEFLDGAVEVIMIHEFEDRPNTKYTTLYDFELKLIQKAQYEWNAEKERFVTVEWGGYEQCEMLANIK